MIEIRVIDALHCQDILLKNQAFQLTGRLIVQYHQSSWSYSVEPAKQVKWQTFPDENYDYDTMKETCQFIGAYDGNHCVGLAILQDDCFRYQYLYDLKVNQAYRRQGIASRLIARCKELAMEKGYRGIRTIAQDTNVEACLFYIKQGFVVGGLDTYCYKGTKQEGKADIHFYLDC